MINEYQKELPYIVKIEPMKNGADNVDPETDELRITFSKEMIVGNYSINYSRKGKDYFPIKKVLGFENSDKTCVLSIQLQPNKKYEFIITNNKFRSKAGYPLREEKYLVQFSTK